MRRILYYSLLCLLWVSVNSCDDEEAAQPPTPSFIVDKTSGLLSDTEFTFTVDQVGAGAVSLLPYGLEKPSLGGILIPASSFTNGKATVKFTYARVGTFNAVAVANNHSGDGSIVKNSVSPPTAITITSDDASMGDFAFKNSSKTEVDDDTHAVTVTMPWNKRGDVTSMALRYSKSAFSKVTVGGVEQKPDTTLHDFSAPVTFTVTSQDGSKSTDYVVTVVVTPAETNTKFKSVTGIIDNKVRFGGGYRVATGRTLPASVNNVDREIVLYDTLGIDPTAYDSVSLDYALDGSLSYAKFATDNQKLKGKDTVDLTTQPLEIVVTAEDSTRATYSVYLVEAPKLHVSFPALIPTVNGSSDAAFAVSMPILQNTDVSPIITNLTFDAPASGALVTSVKIGDDIYPAPFTALPIDYSKSVTVEATVVEGSLTYIATYTVSANVLKP